MQALKIISTVFLGISCVTTILKTSIVFDGPDRNSVVAAWLALLYSWAWRALVITTIWII